MSRHATFENFGMAFLTLFQVSTGDNWNGIMKVLWAGWAGGTRAAFESKGAGDSPGGQASRPSACPAPLYMGGEGKAPSIRGPCLGPRSPVRCR